MLLSLFIFCLYVALIWRGATRVHPLERCPVSTKRAYTVSFGLLTVAFLMVTNYSLLTAICLTLPLIYLYTTHICVFRDSPDAKLTVVPELINRKKAHIHLTKSSDTFCREHYRELIALLEKLNQLGFTQITLTSPLFLKGGTLRELNTLERIAAPNWTLKGKSIPWFQKLFEIISMSFLRWFKKDTVLDKLDLTHWYQITLTHRLAHSDKS